MKNRLELEYSHKGYGLWMNICFHDFEETFSEENTLRESYRDRSLQNFHWNFQTARSERYTEVDN